MRWILMLLLFAAEASADYEKATFAGGCFWCMESPFENLEGVIAVRVGYTGGTVSQPTYAQVSSGTTGHAEAVEITYDPDKISYQQLLNAFWVNIDPTTPNRQFCDVGPQYRTEIFYHTEEQKKLAEASKQHLIEEQKVKPIVTPITPAGPFYPAEEYHQNYAQKNPYRYKIYRYLCGRDARLKDLWGE
ncbi:MAG: peptide-methionine (S)-S-oxide reductase MsrA [Chlamydiia bacterium]|nr:peptide-methionine (S)-S-oxide reductase MsrA [Chlamydiia bacterium]